jgi:hypothetical protein
MRSFLSFVAKLIAIVVCGAAGGVAGYAVRTWLALGGIAGALVAVIVAMVVATLAWAAGTALLRRL